MYMSGIDFFPESPSICLVTRKDHPTCTRITVTHILAYMYIRYLLFSPLSRVIARIGFGNLPQAALNYNINRRYFPLKRDHHHDKPVAAWRYCLFSCECAAFFPRFSLLLFPHLFMKRACNRASFIYPCLIDGG